MWNVVWGTVSVAFLSYACYKVAQGAVYVSLNNIAFGGFFRYKWDKDQDIPGNLSGLGGGVTWLFILFAMREIMDWAFRWLGDVCGDMFH